MLDSRHTDLFTLFPLKDIESFLNITRTHLSRFRKKSDRMHFSTFVEDCYCECEAQGIRLPITYGADRSRYMLCTGDSYSMQVMSVHNVTFGVRKSAGAKIF